MVHVLVSRFALGRVMVFSVAVPMTLAAALPIVLTPLLLTFLRLLGVLTDVSCRGGRELACHGVGFVLHRDGASSAATEHKWRSEK
jgi:hypothetical protein